MVSYKPDFKPKNTGLNFSSNLKASQEIVLEIATKNESEHMSKEMSDSCHNMNRISEYVKEKGGACPIQRVLLANNGIASVKEMRSVRKWAYGTFENDRIVEFVAMATPEDFKANAEYIKLADRVVEVPGGTNNNNFANVDLIVKLAQDCQVQVL